MTSDQVLTIRGTPKHKKVGKPTNAITSGLDTAERGAMLQQEAYEVISENQLQPSSFNFGKYRMIYLKSQTAKFHN